MRATDAVFSLIDLQPKVGLIVNEDGTVSEMPVELIEEGTELLVKIGQTIPLDGVVVKGTTSIDV